jgi:hypothetical protein
MSKVWNPKLIGTAHGITCQRGTVGTALHAVSVSASTNQLSSHAMSAACTALGWQGDNRQARHGSRWTLCPCSTWASCHLLLPLLPDHSAVASSKTEVEVEVNLRPTVSRPVCPGVRRPSGTCDQFLFLLEISFRQLRVCYFVAPSLTRGRVCNLLYNVWSWSSSCGWQSVNQYFWVSGLPLGPLTRFYLSLLFRLTVTLFFVRRRPLWRENWFVVYSAITH